MKKVLIATVIGAFATFLWAFLWWAVIPVSGAAFRALPDERSVLEVLEEQKLEFGVYLYPHENDGEKLWAEKHEAGPLFMLQYRPDGQNPMAPGILLKGVLINLLAIGIAALLLHKASPLLPGFGDRFLFVFLIGLFAVLVGPATTWTFFGTPREVFQAFGLDMVIGSALSGLILAAIVKTPATT